MPQVEAIAAATAESYVLGDPLDPATTMGPLVSSNQRDTVRGFIASGVDEDARLVTGDMEPPDKLDRGFFVKPTVFSNVSRTMVIAQQEIFGPVLAIQPYDPVDEGGRVGAAA